MKFFLQIVLVLALYVVSSYQQNCWWSGCQPSSWGQRGCFPSDQWSQSKSESCPGGDKYYCCPPTNPEQQNCWWSGCQPSDWGQRGCFPSDQWSQSKSESCPGGDKYYCCPAGGSGPPTNPPSGQAKVSFNEFLNAVVSNGYPQPPQAVYDAFVQGLPKGSISSKEEAAMALTQFLHESDGLRAKREYRCISNGCPGDYQDPACDAPGQRYFGRGYIQLTWCANYRAASQDLFGDTSLVTNPDSVAVNENLAWNTAFWFWKVNVHSKQGVSNGLFGATTKAINGALECGSGPNVAIARTRFAMYGKVRTAFGLNGPGDEHGCYN